MSSKTWARKHVAEFLREHVTVELEAIDRMCLNACVASLQIGGRFAYFVKNQVVPRVSSTVMIAPMSEPFVKAIDRFVDAQGLDVVIFEKGQRTDDVTRQRLARFDGEEGVLFVGKDRNFTDKKAANADALFVFQRDIETARKKLASGYAAVR